MKRRLLMVAIFLLLGAVVNVAVAWGLAIGIKAQSELQMGYAETGEETWEVAYWSGAGTVSVTSNRIRKRRIRPVTVPPHPRDLIPAWSGFASPTEEYESGSVFAEIRVAKGRGWPMIGLWYEPYRIYNGNSPTVITIGVQGGIETPLSPWTSSDPRVVPYRLIWPGFAVNTIFYATLLWLFIFAAYALRRRARRKRGLCVACGYDLSHADHAACPECGAVGGQAAAAVG